MNEINITLKNSQMNLISEIKENNFSETLVGIFTVSYYFSQRFLHDTSLVLYRFIKIKNGRLRPLCLREIHVEKVERIFL